MTATMVARAVDLGFVSWPEPALDNLPGEIDRLPAFAGDAIDQRAGLTAHLLEAGPAGPVGEFRYSNASTPSC